MVINMSKEIDEIMKLDGIVELTGPLMVFIHIESGGEEISKESGSQYAIILLREGSLVKVLEKNENAVYGQIVDSETPAGISDEDGKVVPVEDLNDARFITSEIELEKATYVREKNNG